MPAEVDRHPVRFAMIQGLQDVVARRHGNDFLDMHNEIGVLRGPRGASPRPSRAGCESPERNRMIASADERCNNGNSRLVEMGAIPAYDGWLNPARPAAREGRSESFRAD